MTFAQTILAQSDARDVPENLLQQAIIERATEFGYRVFWLPDDMLRIVAQADRFDVMPTPGYPDITIAGNGRLVFVECKAQRGVVRQEQRAWRAAILAAGGEHHVIRPAQWQVGLVEAILRGEA